MRWLTLKRLKRQLASKNDLQRDRALANIERLGGPEGVSLLVDFVEDTRNAKDERERAVRALGGIGNSEAVASLVGMLQRPEHAFRTEAAGALGEIGDPVAVDALVASLKTPGFPADVHRRVTVKALERIGDKRAVTALLSALEGGCIEAVSALDRVGPTWRKRPEARQLIEPLIKSLPQRGQKAGAMLDSIDKDWRTSMTALSVCQEMLSLSQERMDNAQPSHTDSVLLENAVWVIGQISEIQDPHAIQQLTRAQSSVLRGVMRRATLGLERIQPEHIAPDARVIVELLDVLVSDSSSAEEKRTAIHKIEQRIDEHYHSGFGPQGALERMRTADLENAANLQLRIPYSYETTRDNESYFVSGVADTERISSLASAELKHRREL